MHYLQKLPLLFALVAALFSGLIGFIRSVSNDRVLLQMLIAMVVFYIIGFYVRATIHSIIQQVKEKREKEEELRKKQEQTQDNADEEEEMVGKNIDFTAGNIDEDAFEPLKVSEFIKNELKNN